jgi:hypothetical protein
MLYRSECRSTDAGQEFWALVEPAELELVLASEMG